MAFVSVGEMGAVRGTLLLPRKGVWQADLDLVADAAPSGPVTIQIGETLALNGTVRVGTYYEGMAKIRVVGGADGLGRVARPKHYTRPSVRTVLTDLAVAAQETISASAGAEALGTSLANWTTLGVFVGRQLNTLVARGCPDGTTWRILPDGTLWIGSEAWPDSAVGAEDYRELERNDRDRRVELGLDAPLILPGTVLAGDRIDYVEQRFSETAFSARYWTVPA